jgi:hypothetical protein
LEFDDITIACNSGIAMMDGSISTVEDKGDIGQLLGGGEHFDNVGEAEKHRLYQQEADHNPFLPREQLLKIVEMRGLKCPNLVTEIE